VSWDTLEIPLRERNPLFVAARYAPEYPETQLDSPELAQALRAIEIILEHHEPYPSFVINRHWDILKTTKGAMRVASFLGGGIARFAPAPARGDRPSAIGSHREGTARGNASVSRRTPVNGASGT
jgi:hypothetical protein